MTPAIRAALALREHFARGGSLAPGLPMAPFAPAPTPIVATPGLASPRFLVGAHRRAHFADGGAVPPHIFAALQLMDEHRKHFDDGGDSGGGSNSGSDHGSSSGSSGGDSGGSNSSSGSSDSGGSNSSSSSDSSHSSDSGSGSSGGDSSSGSYGGHSDASTGGADTSSASSTPSGGQSDASTGGAGSYGGTGGSVSGSDSNASSGVMGGAGLGASSADSGVSSPSNAISGSMSSPSPSGFGSFSSQGQATPSAYSGGMSTGDLGSSPTNQGLASNPVGAMSQTSSPDAGEDGTTGTSPVSTGQAFSSFGPSSLSAPSSVMGADPGSVAGLSPAGQQFSAMGMNGIDPSIAKASSFGQTGITGDLSASGLSTPSMPGFDNFNGNPTTEGGFTQSSLGAAGYTGGSVGNTGQFGNDVSSATPGNLAGPEGYVGGPLGLGTAPVDASAAAPMAPGTFQAGYQADGSYVGVDGKHYSDMMSDPNNKPTNGPTAESPYGSYSSAAPGVADPSSVDATHALTIHGDLTPGDTFMSAGVPSVPSMNLPVSRDVAIGQDLGMSAMGALGTVAQQPGFGPMSVTGETAIGAPTAAAAPSQVTSSTPGVPDGGYYAGLHTIEGGVLNGQVDPANPTHYGPAQFSQGTWSGVAQNNPGLGLPSSMFSATPAQYSAATQALTNENVAGLQAAGIEATPANTYLAHNLGITGAINALQSGPNASLSEAGISPAVQRSNPSLYGGVSTIGQVQDRISGMLSQGGVDPSVTASAAQPSTPSDPGSTFGLDAGATAMSMGIPGTTMTGVPTQIGKYGTVKAADYSSIGAPTPSSQFAGATNTAQNFPGVTDNGSIGKFGSMAASQADSSGNFSAGATPTSEAGYTGFSPSDGTEAPSLAGSFDSTTAGNPNAPEPSVPSHLSVSPTISNVAAGVALGGLGPIGMGIAGANAVSGLLGGPTIGGAINGILSSPGAPSQVTGSGTNSPSNRPLDGNMVAAVTPPSTASNGDTPSTAAGINPLDPHASAMAAYQAALAGMGKGVAAAPAPAAAAPPLTIHRRASVPAPGPSASLYNPMQDPAVLHALGLA